VDVVTGEKIERCQIPAPGTNRVYVVDFVSFEKKLIIEIDGGQHSAERTKNTTE